VVEEEVQVEIMVVADRVMMVVAVEDLDHQTNLQ